MKIIERLKKMKEKVADKAKEESQLDATLKPVDAGQKFAAMLKCMKSGKDKLQKKQGVKTGVDPKKFERCVLAVKKQGSADNPHAVCNASVKKDQ
jgi:hypothetical protein